MTQPPTTQSATTQPPARRRYRVTHHTTSSYDDEVTDSYGMVCTRPRITAGQAVVEFELWTDPGHADLGTHRDVEDSEFTYFHVTEPHQQLRVSAVSVVTIEVARRDPGVTGQPWEQCRPDLLAAGPSALVSEYVLGSPLVDVATGARAYADPSFANGRGIADAVLGLTHRIHADFEYQPGSTTVTTRIADVLADRRGVCQDFAHLMLAGLRSQGLAARYVSGYLATEPAPGTPPTPRSAPMPRTPGSRSGCPTPPSVSGSRSAPPTTAWSPTGTSPSPMGETTGTFRPSRA